MILILMKFLNREVKLRKAHRKGLEPLTTWSEARYSIQLSYRCKESFVFYGEERYFTRLA